MSENEKGSSHNLNSLVILNPKPLSPLNDMQNNNNFENALQTVKANVLEYIFLKKIFF